MNEKQKVIVNGVERKMTSREVIARRMIRNAAQGDIQSQRQLQRWRLESEKHKIVEDNRPAGGVLVVYPPMKEGEWEKATEGDLLTKNPLEGLIGAELFEPKYRQRLNGRRHFTDDPIFDDDKTNKHDKRDTDEDE